jgi:acetate kinase
VGENDAVVRAKVLDDLEVLGIRIDPEKNRMRTHEARSIHASESRIQIWVVPTNEELQIAIETCQVLTA